MAVYIDKEKAINNLMEYKELPNLFGNSDKLVIRGCIDRIENHLPAADVVEREKIDKAIEEMQNFYGYAPMTADHFIEILKRNI